MQKRLTDNTYIELFTSEEKMLQNWLGICDKKTQHRLQTTAMANTRIIQNYDSLVNPIMAFMVHSLRANSSETTEAMQVGNKQVQNLKHLKHYSDMKWQKSNVKCNKFLTSVNCLMP